MRLCLLYYVRAITSISGNFCKVEKGSTFTHFGPKKHPYQWVQNCAFMHNCYSNRAYMHGYCSTCINILVISLSLSLSLSLSVALTSLSLSPHSSWSTSRLPHEELHRSTSHHCRRSASNHTPPDQIAADHSPLNLRFSHLIKIKPLLPMNSLIKIKPLPPINIKPLPHKAWLNCCRSLSP